MVFTPYNNVFKSLQWRHERIGVSNHRPHDCLLKRLFRRRSKKTSKLRATGLCAWNSPVTGESPHKGPVTRNMILGDSSNKCKTLCCFQSIYGECYALICMVTASSVAHLCNHHVQLCWTECSNLKLQADSCLTMLAWKHRMIFKMWKLWGHV